MADKLMFIPNDDTQNSKDYNQDTQLNESTNHNSIKALKVGKQMNFKISNLKFN